MSNMVKSYKPGLVIDITASGAISAGVPQSVAGRCGLPNSDIADGKLGSLQVDGIVKAPMAAVTITAGQQIGWDNNGTPVTGTAASGAATNVAADMDVLMGSAVAAQADTDSYVYVALNKFANAESAKTNTGDGEISIGDGTTVNDVTVSGDATLANTGALTIAALAVETGMLALLAVDTGQLADDAVTLAKMDDLAQGSVIVGGAADAPTALDAKTSGQILVGDGTDLKSVAVSGDIALASTGAATIQALAVETGMLALLAVDTGQIADDAVTLAKMDDLAQGSVIVGGAADAPTALDAKTSGQILVGDGADLKSVAVSGDIALASTGAATIAALAVETGMLADDAVTAAKLADSSLSSLHPQNLADKGNTLPIVISAEFADADGDVQIYNANCPAKMKIIDAWVENRGANGANANSVQVCAGAGGTDAITDAMSLNAKADTDIVRAATIDTTEGTVAAGGSLYLDVVKAAGTMGGTVYILAVRVA